jgi:sulfate adenylyltransferase subunit 2
MDHVDQLESDSVFILREAFRAIPKLAMLWSFGKDSNVLVHLAHKAFFGRVPFPLVHCDTGLEFPEVYQFRDRYVKEWNVDLISHSCPPLEKTDASLPNPARAAARKTLGLQDVMAKYGFTGIISGIRRDEEATRAKERIFSPRDMKGEWQVRSQPLELFGLYNTHVPAGGSVRIHPLLNWSELDIWRYIQRENIPVVPLYFSKKGQRFRSIGERGITFPMASNAASIIDIIKELQSIKISERAGRPMGADEDESSFERLRTAGYM